MTALEQDGDGAARPAGSTAADRIRDVVQRARRAQPGFRPLEAVAATDTADVAHFLHPHFARSEALEALAVGVPASPGAASGRLALTADQVIEAAGRGEAAILVRSETGPEDVLGMQMAAGVLTARGGLASHAAVIARGWGIPAVVGCRSLVVEADGVVIGGRALKRGDLVSIDGHTGEVYAGATTVQSESAPPEMDVLLGWADQLRGGRVGVRANADDDTAARHARTLGAEGIGLCRTEHMFLAEDRLPLVRRLILSDRPEVDAEALDALEEVQRRDFEALLEAMDGLPVTVRLLDPPLHEFLPPIEPLIVAEARGELDADGIGVLAAVRRLSETNPMIGTRGVRLGMVKPGLYPMQVRAISRAVQALQARGLSPHVEVMIPLVVNAAELKVARQWVDQAENEAGLAGGGRQAVSVGTMIETPRAALVAGELAELADFFSFGTNDLTQLTFAFSRDDVEAELIPRYIEEGLLDANPFEILDQVGVGFLIRHTIEAARAARPSIKIGACGEQAGDPVSARFLVTSGLDYVSCSPYRLPVVRLAVAQALIGLGLSAQVTVSPEPGEGSVTAPEAGPGEVPADATFRVLHALRIKGFAGTEILAEMTGVAEAVALAELEQAREGELVKFHEARGFWQLTPTGRDRHAELLAGPVEGDIDAVRIAYTGFLELNVAFKELCLGWQMRDGVPNDHTDTGYDRMQVEALAAHDRAARPVLAGFAAGLARLGLYADRLSDALGRLEAGQRDAFTGVMKRSYHDVWMELHEDLLCILGIDRRAEGSF